MPAPADHRVRNSELLGTAPVGPLLLKFSLPSILGTMTFASTNIVNTIFIGRGVGPLALAAISLSFPVFAIFMAVGMLIGIGGGALVSIRLGEGKSEEAERILGNCFFLFVTVSLALSALGLAFLTPLLKAFGASPATLPYAHAYLQIILCGSILNALTMGLNNLIRSEGHPRTAMFTMLIGAVINVILNYFFVMRFGWGVRGAAVATILSMSVSAAWVLTHFIRGRNGLRLRLSNLGFDFGLMKPALLIGLSPFLLQILNSLVGAIANRGLSVHGGDTAVAAIAVINTVAMLFIFPIIGINQGAQPLLGFNHGAKKPDRVRRTLLLAIGLASALAFAGWLLAHLVPETLIRLFSKDNPILLEDGVRGLNIFLGLFFLVGFQAMAANYFQAVGRPSTAIVLNLLRQGVILIPLLLILPRFMGLDGIWYSAPVADALASIITAVVIVREFRRLAASPAS